jgi:hypothetical protein
MDVRGVLSPSSELHQSKCQYQHRGLGHKTVSAMSRTCLVFHELLTTHEHPGATLRAFKSNFLRGTPGYLVDIERIFPRTSC